MRKALRQWAVLSAAVAGVLGSGGGVLAAPAVWDGDAPVGTPGDNVTWGNAANWTTGGAPDVAPSDAAPGDDLTFGGGTAGGVIDLGAARVANILTFNKNYSLGLAATTLVLTNTSGNVSVITGNTATINAVLAGANGIRLTGGGTLLLNRATGNTFGGNITVDGAGTTLAWLGTNSSADPTALGAGARSVTLTNGGGVSVAGARCPTRPTAPSRSSSARAVGGSTRPAGRRSNSTTPTSSAAPPTSPRPARARCSSTTRRLPTPARPSTSTAARSGSAPTPASSAPGPSRSTWPAGRPTTT